MTKHKSTNLNYSDSHLFKIAKDAMFSHMQDVGLSSKGDFIYLGWCWMVTLKKLD
jgi:hypothetical protein